MMSSQPTLLEIGPDSLNVEDVCHIAHRLRECRLSQDADWRSRITDNHRLFQSLVEGGEPVYGVTTGFGNSCTVEVREQLIAELPANLIRFHGCGMGAPFSPEETRAILVARLKSLAAGHSGVRLELLEHLALLLQHDVLPVIPSEGSVGASGDLTPLSYVAAVLTGEREVWVEGRRMPTRDAFALKGLSPLALQPKESLALMNGTAAMTGLACLGWSRAHYALQLATRISTLAATALKANRDHFAPELFAAKPHPGQAEVAANIFRELDIPGARSKPDHIQDRYSIRCAPHVLGVLADALPWMRTQIETELNSANDNPIVDSGSGRIFHGGHFYGGHIAFAMDCMKNAVANVADLIDRQVALLVDTTYNFGLPANLTGTTGQRKPIQHGFKALQIAVSAWTAEALKLTMPASVFSRSTECHNQDKVSMGTIAARDTVRVIELVEQVLAAGILVTCQGVSLRRRENPDLALHVDLLEFCADVQEVFPFLEEDRPLDSTLEELCARIRSRHWKVDPNG